MEEAGVPKGVFNMVHGIGEVAGAALVAHPDVPLISFTGETTTGQTIMRSAADHLKGLSMELGGKSPCVVFADADLAGGTRQRVVRSLLAERRAVHRGVTSAGRTPVVRRVRHRLGASAPRRSASAIRATRPPSWAR